MIDLSGITGFDWDAGNSRKNDKHGVSAGEAEQVFFNVPLLLLADESHSLSEARHHALGQSDGGRMLHITFTVRRTLIRGISARDGSRKERAIFEQAGG